MNSTDDMPSGAPAGNQPDGQSGDGDMAPFERWLDRKLKTVYGSVLEEPIPQDLIDLLKNRLDGK